MRFLVDMNLSQEVAAELRRQGHDAVHLREEGLGRLDDAAVFRKAITENDAFVVTAYLTDRPKDGEDLWSTG